MVLSIIICKSISIIYDIFCSSKPSYKPTCCLCCSPRAASSNFQLHFAWAPLEAPCCLFLTSLSLHQHCGQFLSLSQVLLSSARGPPPACADPVAPAGPRKYNFFFSYPTIWYVIFFITYSVCSYPVYSIQQAALQLAVHL